MRVLMVGDGAAGAEGGGPAALRLARVLRERGWQLVRRGADADIVVVALPSWRRDDAIAQARALSPAALVVVLSDGGGDTGTDGRLAAMRAGADDLLDAAAPGDLIIDRLLALLRLRRQGPRLSYTLGDLSVDMRWRRVRRGGGDIQLSSREFQLLVLLLQADGAVVPRSAILDRLWAGDLEIGDNAVDALASRLRRRLDAAGPRLLHTARGVGYRLGPVGQGRGGQGRMGQEAADRAA